MQNNFVLAATGLVRGIEEIDERLLKQKILRAELINSEFAEIGA